MKNMKKLAIGLVAVVCLILVIVAAKSWYDDQNLLLHPKEWYTADLFLDAAYVNSTSGAVFVDLSVYRADDGFVNFTTATIRDRNGNVLANHDAFNTVVVSGQSATLRVNCDCLVSEKATITICASGWGTLSREITQGNPPS